MASRTGTTCSRSKSFPPSTNCCITNCSAKTADCSATKTLSLLSLRKRAIAQHTTPVEFHWPFLAQQAAASASASASASAASASALAATQEGDEQVPNHRLGFSYSYRAPEVPTMKPPENETLKQNSRWESQPAAKKADQPPRGCTLLRSISHNTDEGDEDEDEDDCDIMEASSADISAVTLSFTTSDLEEPELCRWESDESWGRDTTPTCCSSREPFFYPKQLNPRTREQTSQEVQGPPMRPDRKTSMAPACC